MMRTGTTLLALALLAGTTEYVYGQMDVSGVTNGCSLMTPSEAAKLLNADSSMVTTESANPENGHLQCRYKAAHHVVGGSDAPSMELVLDFYRLSDVKRAKKNLASLGTPHIMVKTADGPAADDAVLLPEQISGPVLNRFPGYAVRHNQNLVVMQMSGGFINPRGTSWDVDTQTAAFKAAGAIVLGSAFKPVCDLVPIADMQTLMTLQPATVTTADLYKGSMTDCRFQVSAGGSGDSGSYLDIEVKRDQTPRDIEFEMEKGNRSDMAQTQDPNDFTIVPPGTRGKATAVHGTTIATINVDNPDAYAVVSPSYAYRVQRAALQAAGATIVPTTKYGPDPEPKPLLPPPPSLWDRVMDLFGPGTLPILIPLVVFGSLFWGWFSRMRLKGRLMTDGMNGTARIDRISDTGTTVNNRPLVRFHCTITAEDGQTYQAETTKLVSRLVAPVSLVGNSYPVKIDREMVQKFVFVNDF